MKLFYLDEKEQKHFIGEAPTKIELIDILLNDLKSKFVYISGQQAEAMITSSTLFSLGKNRYAIEENLI